MTSIKDCEQYFEASFEKLELPEKHYEDIEFEECRFFDCNFSQTAFRNCKFTNCEFVRCNLSSMDLPNTRLFGVTFKETKLIGVDWAKANWPVFHLDFELDFDRCIMNDSSFFGLTLNELMLVECKLHDVDFREGNFAGSAMTYCDFTQSLFTRTNLRNVDFSESTGYAINVLNNEVEGARFSRHEALSLLESLGIVLVD
ncbi:pentapeptide repeat-containing protein [Haliea sp. E1-2-M8]|uniref:pentapeptide repeat-containing protein n=1 Tax=Haliea sp. E1-2-M8 TaxID=3064706 RepID=UPI0027166ACB|nr:pentapeptide repeat-containing protein [Haliea sp. E1-2-M8]MDO8862726.1 pentapeptide repeat-containing protein [Haliea sp. E1-2-M8]